MITRGDEQRNVKVFENRAGSLVLPNDLVICEAILRGQTIATDKITSMEDKSRFDGIDLDNEVFEVVGSIYDCCFLGVAL